MYVELVIAAVGPQGEQLHRLARVVLVRAPFRVLGPVEPHQHPRIARHLDEQVVEVAKRTGAHHLVLVEHQCGVRRVDRGREPAVPDQGHPLDQLVAGADHAIKPPAVVVPPDAGWIQRAALPVARGSPRQLCRPRRPRQRADGAVESERREPAGLPGLGPETGAPQQPRRLTLGERAAVGGDRRAWKRRHGRPRWPKAAHYQLSAGLYPPMSPRLARCAD